MSKCWIFFISLEGYSNRSTEQDTLNSTSTNEPLNDLSQNSSFEYNFFLTLFSSVHISKVETPSLSIASLNFVKLVETRAQFISENDDKLNIPNIQVYDRIVNGRVEGLGDLWKTVDPYFTNYTVLLDSIPEMVDQMTQNKSISESVIKRLRQFALGVSHIIYSQYIDYRVMCIFAEDCIFESYENQFDIVMKWQNITLKLDMILSEPDRFRTMSTVDFYQEKDQNGHSMNCFII